MISPQWSSTLGSVHSPQTQERKPCWYSTLMFSRKKKKKSFNTQKRFYGSDIISAYFPLTSLPCTVKPTHWKLSSSLMIYVSVLFRFAKKRESRYTFPCLQHTAAPHIPQVTYQSWYSWLFVKPSGNRSPRQLTIMFMKLSIFYCRTVANNVIPQECSMQLSCFIHQHGVSRCCDSLNSFSTYIVQPIRKAFWWPLGKLWKRPSFTFKGSLFQSKQAIDLK